jgi:hypothetical protein
LVLSVYVAVEFSFAFTLPVPPCRDWAVAVCEKLEVAPVAEVAV